ncbi:SbcC/MukB-like Walker B domain-containing protein [Pseudacidovorax sp. RU35E]|uniref:SbcC/MukB-like Walker B domain-containing protein n=1 Tax=Pseudacidovorax sp. RU35E TaxID=1907403 RepID=UPI0009557C25|nr:SbcC/MukB-like Walker B domain-containing protein [Pseudacidovorax sp. RU35E]SIR47158.1 Putative exonuclease SbcCD, C subunit [Pseudacidovorax sp. RU35E]
MHRKAVDAKNKEDVKGQGLGKDVDKLNGKLSELARLWPTADRAPAFAEQIAARYLATDKDVTLENLDQVHTQVDRGLSNELRALDTRLTELKGSIVQRFLEFNRLWPAVAGGLDATLASADDYLAKLKRLEDDNLPAYEDRFFGLLREQSDQNLTLLATKLDEERSAIRSRMELVNESLETAPFNPGTHLVIETTDQSLEDVRLFRASLKDSLSHSFSNDRDLAEERFKALAALVKRLASQETADKNWRHLVLDVRQHVEFVARELDADDVEVEVYRSGAGKSGGQRQKLAATCLAAALRYQLGGQDRALPSYSTVVLDEAFDKADAEFTAMAMSPTA